MYRAARKADPTWFTPQHEYIHLMFYRFRGPEVSREFAIQDSSSALKLCLAAASQRSADLAKAAERLLAIETRFGPTPCTDAFLVGLPGGYSEARGVRAMRDSPRLMEVWGAVAGQLKEVGHWQAAERTLKAGIEAADSPIGRVHITLPLADLHGGRHDTAAALAVWKSLDAWVRRDARPGPMAVYLGVRCNGQNTVPRASAKSRTDACEEFYGLVRPRHALSAEWEMIRWLGKFALERGDLVAATPVLSRAVQLADSLGTPGLQLASYTMRGRAYYKAGKIPLALRDLMRATVVGQAAELPNFYAEAWHNLAHTYEAAGRLAEAAVAADSFGAIADREPWNALRYGARHDAGTIRWSAGWHVAAKRDFDEMVRIIDEFKTEGHYFAGEYFERVGQLGRALKYYGAGSRVRNGDPRSFAALVRVFEALGFPDSAEAAARAHDADDSQWPILEQPMLPDVLARRGRLNEAVSLASGWAKRQYTSGNVEGAAIAHLRLAEFLLMGNDPKAAHSAAARADSLARSLRLTAQITKARTLEGRALVAQGDFTGGLVALREGARLAIAHPSTEAVLAANIALGDALASRGWRADALVAYDHAAAAVERMTAGLNEDQYRTGFKSLHLAPFDGALRVLLSAPASEPDAAAALAWSARRKAAALTLAGQPSAANRRLVLSEVRSRLRADEALVDFTALDSTVTAIVVRRESVTRVPLSASSAQLTAWTATLRRPLVTTPGGRIDLAHAHFDAAVAESLYRALIQPLRPALTGVKSLAIAPDGALWYVPFAALVTGRAQGRASYLIEQYELRLLPSPQFLGSDATSKLPAGFRVSALSYSVPGGAAELAAIRKSLGTARVVSRDSTSATERAALSASASVLHLAVHGVMDDRDPLASHLRLAPEAPSDGLLHLSEVAALRASPRLVVLTACEAVSGKLYAGEGLVGLARAFLMSGARQVIASEWPVAASAAELTGVLYREMAAGQSPAASLRSAQLTLLKNPDTAHPIHWAGFVVFEGGSARGRR